MRAEINLVNPELYATGDPYAQFRWLRANEPAYWHPATDIPAFWALTRYDDVRAAYRDPATFSSAQGILLRPANLGPDPGGGRTLALTDPPRHRRLRGLVDEWFTVRSVRSIEAQIQHVVGEVVDQALERQTCDFVTEIAARVPLYVICTMMGVPNQDRSRLFTLTSQAFGAEDPIIRRFGHLEIMQYFERLQAAKAADPGDDLVSVLATAVVDGRRLPVDDILLQCDNLLVAGAETARITAAGGMLALMEHPDQWHLLEQDPGLLPTAVEEILRWTSTATHLMRTATRRVTLHGRTIEPGDRVTLWTPSANRDETVFDNPDRFTVGRHPNRHLALGFGEHFCLGGTLARVELRLLYHELLRRSIHVELDGEPTLLSSMVVNGPERLPVRLSVGARSGWSPG